MYTPLSPPWFLIIYLVLQHFMKTHQISFYVKKVRLEYRAFFLGFCLKILTVKKKCIKLAALKIIINLKNYIYAGYD